MGWAISVLYGDGDGGFRPPLSLEAKGTAPTGMASLGPTRQARALVVDDYCVGGMTIYGDSAKY